MNLIFDRAFYKDIERIKDRKLKQRIEVALLALQSADSLYGFLEMLSRYQGHQITTAFALVIIDSYLKK